jgi:hypothetical protein
MPNEVLVIAVVLAVLGLWLLAARFLAVQHRTVAAVETATRSNPSRTARLLG